jgi:hypothetical protein
MARATRLRALKMERPYNETPFRGDTVEHLEQRQRFANEVVTGHEIIVGARRLLRPRYVVVRQAGFKITACETAQASALRLGTKPDECSRRGAPSERPRARRIAPYTMGVYAPTLFTFARTTFGAIGFALGSGRFRTARGADLLH